MSPANVVNVVKATISDGRRRAGPPFRVGRTSLNTNAMLAVRYSSVKPESLTGAAEREGDGYATRLDEIEDQIKLRG